jgi:hypothetical protein
MAENFQQRNLELAYPADFDKRILYESEPILLDGRNFIVRGGTIAGSYESIGGRKNEDTIAGYYHAPTDTMYLGVYDGNSSLRQLLSPQQTPVSVSGARLASWSLRDSLARVVQEGLVSPKEILIRQNDLLLEDVRKVATVDLQDKLRLPGSTGTLIAVNKKTGFVSFASVGDSSGIVYFTDGSSQVCVPHIHPELEQADINNRIECKRSLGICNEL